MYSNWQRANNIFALGSTVFISLLAFIAALSQVLPPSQIPKAKVTIKALVVENAKRSSIGPNGRVYHEPQQDNAYLKVDIDADLRGLFGWNTKQLFVYLVVDYNTTSNAQPLGLPDTSPKQNKRHQLVAWDRIIKRGKDAKFVIKDRKNKYPLREYSRSFRNLTGVWSLHYNVMPYVGILSYGQVGHTGLIPFPPPAM